jgi:serine/threonine-protein kinase
VSWNKKWKILTEGRGILWFGLSLLWTATDRIPRRTAVMPDPELVRKLLLQWDEDTAATPEVLCLPYSDRPDYGELLQTVREAIGGRRPVAPSTEISSDSWRTRTPAVNSTQTKDQALCDPAIDSPPTGLRYRPVAQHRRGGLGEVLVADDTELHRKVALKRIRVDRCHDTHGQREFLREAEITARLEHPGIVPVHGLVHDAEGQPYYAMRFIEGETLSDAVKQFHEADQIPGRDPGERSLALRELLNRFVAVCNTIAYAHSRGVLHRDLKPHNIMLGKYGETLVVDWGLAKSFERSEEARATGEETVRPRALPEEGHQTRPGDTKGTPAYMSPEQALGRVNEIGPAGDIFALGATLYAILTGLAPYQGSNSLAKAKRAEFDAPRQVQPQVPRPLEAICLKAMALKPEDRYATAKALANDVEKWLADEPVAAHPESRAAKLRRWAKRHRLLVTTAAALLGATVVGLGLGLAAVERERERTAHERDEKAKALAAESVARENEQQARERTLAALRDLTDDLVENQIARGAYLTDENKEFLRKIIKHFEGFAAMTADDAASRAIRAEGYHRVGHMRHRLGELEGAATALAEALAIRKQLVADFPARPEFRQALAMSQNHLGTLLKETGKVQEAATNYAGALTNFKQLTADFPTRPEYRQGLAGTHSNVGMLLAHTGRSQEAATAHADAVAGFKQLAAEFPTRPEFRRDLAMSLHNSALALAQLGKHEDAATNSNEALAIYQRLASDFPSRTEFREEVAGSHKNLGALLAQTGKEQEAAKAFDTALVIHKQLAAEFPTRPEYRSALAGTHNNLGMLFAQTGKLEQAATAYGDALAIDKQLGVDFPNRPEFRRQSAGTHNNLGNLHSHMGKLQAAATDYTEALAIRKQLAADFPSSPDYRQDLAMGHNNLAIILARTGKLQEAATGFAAAAAIQKKLATEFPARPDFRKDLAQSHNNMGNLHTIQGKMQEATTAYGEALAIRRQLAADFPHQPDLHNDLAGTLGNLATLCNQKRDFAGAKAYMQEAEPHHQAALKASPRNPTYCQIYQSNLRMLVHANAGLLDQAAAVKAAEKKRDLDWDPPSDAYNAACALALCIPIVEKVDKIETAKRQAAILFYGDQAMAMLRDAVAKGFNDALFMKQDDDLKALRNRDDFKKLVADLEAANAKKP